MATKFAGPEEMFSDLNAAYRTAFEKWASEAQILQPLIQQDADDPESRRAWELLIAAESDYRLRRDRLAEFLMQVPAEPCPEGEMHARIERLAYQLWEDAGCPHGTAESDWLRAEHLIRRHCRGSN